ncbi:MAG: hypothetical protein QOJ79_2010 [Actinomycetota bacterium]|nr:hypothetical protein [Actinomycetota bacterium]
MRALVVMSCLCVVLAGCSSSGSPQAELQNRMNAITEAANAKDAAALRSAVSDFLQEVRQQSANADITLRKAQDLQTVATRLLAEASVLEVTEPSPTPSAPPSPSPSPSAEPSPAPSPSPTEAAPTPSPSPIIEVSMSPAGGLFSPAASAAP